MTELRDTMQKVSDMSKQISEISDKIVSKYCEPLEKIMLMLKDELKQSQNIDNERLERYILNLANTLYFIGSAQEDIGVREDISKSIRQEVYNQCREQADGTIADKNMKAETETQKETMVCSIYSRAYKKIKLKMDAGNEMLNSLKKIMNKRISEIELTRGKYTGCSTK